MSDLAQYPRIHLGSFDSTKCDRADKFFGTTEFDVIIDDASHALENQLANLSVYLPRLKSGGFYIIEDVANESNADVLVRVLQQSPVDVVISRGKIEQREDDRLIVAQRH
jgi:cephalosporin hydroxylase